jgi:hypothetical protein
MKTQTRFLFLSFDARTLQEGDKAIANIFDRDDTPCLVLVR